MDRSVDTEGSKSMYNSYLHPNPVQWNSWDAYYRGFGGTVARASAVHSQCRQLPDGHGSAHSGPVLVCADGTSAKIVNSSQSSKPKPTPTVYVSSDEEDGEDDAATVIDSNFSYSVKFVNPSHKSDFKVEKWRTSVKFLRVDQLKASLNGDFAELGNSQEYSIGYIEPGHGWKGKQRWITTNEDLSDMYETFNSRKEILLWCHLPQKQSQGKKRKNASVDAGNEAKRTKSSAAIETKLNESKEMVTKLKEMHGKKYSPEQLHAWSQLIQLGKHDSYDEAPNFPFFKRNKEKSKLSKESDLVSNESGPSSPRPTASTMAAVSPGRRINLRSACIQQLQQLGELFEKGNISSDQHEKLQETILSDIYKF